ncbi:MAG: hypothetical protein A2158_00540 [Chloroflexi bacterium RBG_13_46_14]|nr:MAG: hypothetical protein A2158_00540 [Chloroflexi bacterium RBG_13_46_14]
MGMHLHLRHDSGAKRLPKPIQEYMKKRFMLSESYLKTLRSIEYEGVVGEKQVRRFSIFSMSEADNKSSMIKTKNDLDKNPKMILFEGYIDKAGKAYAADRRSPKTGKKTST